MSSDSRYHPSQLTRFALLLAGLGWAGAAQGLEVAGYPLDPARAPDQAELIEGSGQTHRHKTFTALNAQPDPTRNLDNSRSIGRLLEEGKSNDIATARHFSFPEAFTPPAANTHRVVLELRWTRFHPVNGPGPDLMVLEGGSFEPFAVAVKPTGQPSFTTYQFRHAKAADDSLDVAVVILELKDFGLEEGSSIEAVRFMNLYNEESPFGADRVDGKDGQGRLVQSTDPGYDTAHPARLSPGENGIPSASLDSDLLFISSLQPIPEKTQP